MNNNRTLIDDLPQLEQLQSSAINKTRSHHPANAYEDYNSSQMPQKQDESYYPPLNHYQDHDDNYHNQSYYSPYDNYYDRSNAPQGPSAASIVMPSPEELSCAIVAKHVDNCPICRKFYDTDVSKYIITIIALVILNIYLLRKII
jgi:hypothetical protein